MKPCSASVRAVSSFPHPLGWQTDLTLMSCFLFIPTPPWPAGLSPHSPEDQAGKVRWEVRLGFGWSYFCLCSVADRQVGHSTPTLGSGARPTKGCVLMTSETLVEACGFSFLLGSMLPLVTSRGVGEGRGGPPGSQVRPCPLLASPEPGLLSL